jgi:[glutamine synthetase] adenylyltransferase / [glutamine synthetase]-adenylyl-L-tyrosine phosphorylase
MITPKLRAGAAPEAGALAGRIVAAPHCAEPRAGAQKVEDWLRSIHRRADGRTLKNLFTSHPRTRTLIDGLAEGSPFLWDLAHRQPDRLVRLLEADPDAAHKSLLDGTVQGVASSADETEAMRLLRSMKAEAALLIALADIGGVWPLARVTQALTDTADAAISAALRFLLKAAAQSGKINLTDRENLEAGCGFAVLAMGKMGAGELNYSSDIDLICLFDPEPAALAKDVEPAPFYIRLTRNLARMLQERTVEGYVFRVDLRLRPDPGLTQIALSTASALGYYESVGLTWERAAMIKARVCAGDIAIGDAFLRQLSPFIWRKYLDYAAISDIQAMKRQMHSYRGHDEIAVEGHNIKLGRGGIREVEFFVQTQQLIAGGRHPELRGQETLAMLAALAHGGWISEDAQRELHAAYEFLRTVEHRLQMVNDEQTQTLPADTAEFDTFACFMGYPNRQAFAEPLLHHLRNVQRHYAQLFEDAAPAVGPSTAPLAFPAASDDRDTLDRLATMGFKRPLEASALVRAWFSGNYRALRSELAREQLESLAPALLTHFARSENPDAALLAFDRFLGGLRGGARLLSLLRQNADLVTLIAVLLGAAPRLAEVVGQHPEVMDALIDPAFFGLMPDQERLGASLDRSLAEITSYEDFLDRVRLFRQEQLFLIGTRILSGTISARQAGEAFAAVAEALIRRVHSAVEGVFTEAHGRIPGQQTAVLALGKLGGREMTAGSDLDLIVIYDMDPEQPESTGPRKLTGSQYFARLTQRFIAALTAQTSHGALYPVDMRLRPSGRSGPVATQVNSFEDYQRHEAWAWEHMALTRARVVAGSPEFSARIEAAIRDVLRQPRDLALLAADVVEMRRAIATEKGDSEKWDLKYVAGGLVDLEFLAQYLQLAHAAEHPEILDTSTAAVFDKARRLGSISAEDADVLRPAVRLYHDLTQILRLCLSGPFDPKKAGIELLRLLARAADLPDFTTLDAHLDEIQRQVRASFVRILGGEP